ncbi:Leucine-rich repeat, cysteine-containing subtype [Parasponia andersonii]|uniref:Leucine-rich repeat, cysteine-containing subtype n=1 Tax=Parasponia andersonii TaxID=3476 RepID=A0A2P5AXN0_PARAD|nr:Leucine-rich repeat, cysteine-containing subtype [Parasponia andersonii]
MRVLRSRQIVSADTTPKIQKATRQKLNNTTNNNNVEPCTPAQTKEVDPSALSSFSSPSPHPHRPSNPASHSIGSRPGSASVPGLLRRRSLRLASKTADPDEVSARNLVEDGHRGRMSGGSGENVAVSRGENEGGIDDDGVLGMEVKRERDFTLFGKRFRVFEHVGEGEDKVEVHEAIVGGLGEPGLCSDSGNFGRKSEGTKEKGKGKRTFGFDINFPASECEEDGEARKVFLSLRSGKKVAKRGLEVEGVEREMEVEDLGNFGKDISEREEKRKGKLAEAEYRILSNVVDLVELDLEQELGTLDVDAVEGDGGESILEREAVGGSGKGKRKISSASEEGGSTVEILDIDPVAIENVIRKGKKRFSSGEKGKGKLLEEDTQAPDIIGDDDKVGFGLEFESEVKISVDNVVLNATSLANNVASEEGQARNANAIENVSNRNEFKERSRDIARKNATRFALFDREEEERDELPAEDDAEQDIEAWPGPFSTALKIIKDRETRNGRLGSSFLGERKPAQLVWVPKNSQDCESSKRCVPSLLELSLRGLANNADSIVSLEVVPDWLRHRLTQLLCDSRRMNGHVFKLLVQGSPSEVRLRDCSWLTEEEFTKSFQNFDPSKLVVLQLDQCGRCLPDYVLLATLAWSANNLPALTTVSLRGACRLSDVGLKSLVFSAPALRSLNLGQCSLLTSSSIDALADSMGSVLRELYLDDCQNIDVMLTLPALKKFEQLEVLSLAGIETVCDDFLMEFISIRGHNMKELVLTDCIKLTDSSLKIIAETCSGLLAIDLRNLCKLTDSALLYLANGCRTIQRLELCRNSFSDKSIAAFLETSGECLEQLTLNNVKKVGCQTAFLIGRCSRKLHTLDLSWCRNLTDKELGFVVDRCLSLRVLKLFGCTQITDVFLNGHSNPEVQIIGLQMSPVLEHVWVPNPYEAPLRYSSVPSSF